MTLYYAVSFVFNPKPKFIHMRLLAIFTLFTCLLSITSCSKNIQEQIDEYLEDNNLQAESTADGLYYIIEEPGSAEMPNITNTVTVHYRGVLTNGNQFDSSYDRGETFVTPLTGVIKGWQLGIPLFGKGGKGKLIIPPSLGYGSRANGDIPANSVLVFDIELIDFE